MPSAKHSSLRVNFIYNTAYQVLAIIIPLITTPYLTRKLGAEQIGVFSYSNSIAYCFAIFAMLGVNNYGNRSIAMARDNKEELSNKFLEIYAFQLLTSIVSVATYFFYIAVWAEDKCISMVFLMYVVSSAFDVNWFFFGMEKFKITTARNVFVKLFTVILIFILVKTPNDVYKYAFIYSSGILASQIVMWVSIKKYIVIKRIAFRGVVSHIKPNLVLFIPVIAVSLYKFMDKIMLGAISTKTEVGFYESSDRMILVPSVLINSLGAVMLPRMSNLVANNKKENGLAYLSKSIRFVSFLASSLSFGIMGIASVFVPLYYGPGFDKCITLFYILLPSCIFVGFANVLRTQYMIPNHMDTGYTISVLSGTAINLLLNWLLIPKHGSIGAAVATLAAEIIVWMIHCAYVYKKLPLFYYFKSCLPAIVSGVIMFLSLKYLTVAATSSGVLNVLLKILFGAFVYLITYAVLNFNLIIKTMKGQRTR